MSFLTPNWSVIDPAAWDDDKPLHSALLQRAAINGHYIQRNHTRSTSIGYDHGERPLMCGAVPPNSSTAGLERVCIPYLWEPSDATEVKVTVSLEMFIPSGSGTFELDVHWQEWRDFVGPPIRDRRVPVDAGSNEGVSTISATGDTIESFTLDLSLRSPGMTGPIVIWVTGQSSETTTGSSQGANNSLNRIRTRTIEVNSGTISDDLRPTEVVYLYGTGAGQADGLPTRRQVIRKEQGIGDHDSDDVIYTWPPYATSWSDNDELQVLKTKVVPLPEFRHLTSIKLYGVSFEDQTPLVPSYGSKLNAGQGPGSSAAQYLYRQSASPFLSRTSPHAAGSVADTTVVDDFDSTTVCNQNYPNVILSNSWQTVASAYLQHRNSFQPPDDASDDIAIGKHIRALVVFDFAPNRINPTEPGFGQDFNDFINGAPNFSLDVSFRAQLSSETGSATDSGAESIVRMVPIGYDPHLDVDGVRINRCAALLNLQRGIYNSVTGAGGSNSNTHANSLSGALPESSWSDCAAGYIDVSIDDGSDGQRIIGLQSKIAGNPLFSSRVHVISWLVTDSEYTDETSVAGIN